MTGAMALIPGIEARRGPESRRAAIIDAASRVFAREGFAGTGIDAIASEAGVSRQTIYNLIGDLIMSHVSPPQQHIRLG